MNKWNSRIIKTLACFPHLQIIKQLLIRLSGCFVFVCMWYDIYHICVYVLCVYIHIYMSVCVGLILSEYHEYHPGSFPILINWGRVSHLNLRAIHLSNLSIQPASGIPSHILGLQVGLHPIQYTCDAVEVQTSVLAWGWFPHWVIFPALPILFVLWVYSCKTP